MEVSLSNVECLVVMLKKQGEMKEKFYPKLREWARTGKVVKSPGRILSIDDVEEAIKRVADNTDDKNNAASDAPSAKNRKNDDTSSVRRPSHPRNQVKITKRTMRRQ